MGLVSVDGEGRGREMEGMEKRKMEASEIKKRRKLKREAIQTWYHASLVN